MMQGQKSIFSLPGKSVFLVAGILLILAIFPAFHLSGYTLRLMSMIFMWIALASCWNVMSGYTGYIDFGPVVYFGIGAYSTALLMSRGGMPFFLSIVISGVVAVLFAIPVGLPTLRLRGAYFAIATFAFAEAMKQVALEWDRVVGVHFLEGSHGITLPIGPSHQFFYYTFLVIMTVLFLTSYLIERSRMGYALKAIHEAEDAAELSGVNTLKIKVSAYAISAFFTGIIGGVDAYWLTYITPNDVFSIHITIQMVIMCLLGGMGTLLGPVVGASFLTLVSEPLWAKFPYDYLIIIGVIIVVVIVAMPRGIVGTLMERKRRGGGT